jgi:cupin 2 domain-containing protein
MGNSIFNFLENIPDCSKDEIFETILSSKDVKIERIISYGQATNSEFWYDQDEGEFVIVLKGESKIKYNNEKIYELKTGDSLYIPAHQKHQVIYTADPTIWLAIFIK